MKKNLTKKLMLSVLTLAFAVVSLGASTFAWFTTSENAKVDNFQMDVTAEAGIQVAVSAVDGSAKSNYYVNDLPTERIYDVFAAKGFKNFLDVTAYYPGDADNAASSKFAGELYDKAGTPVDEADGYVALRLYVKADADGVITVTIPWLTNTVAPIAWAAGTEFNRDGVKIGAADKYLFDVLSATRMSICYAGVYTTYEAVEAPKGDVNDTFGNTLGYCSDLFDGSLKVYNTYHGGYKLDDKGTVETTDDTYELTNTAQVNVPNAEEGTVQINDGKHEFAIPVTRNVEQYFDLYIWVEGFDAECVNAIFAQQLQTSIAFAFAQN